ncbi:MAG: cob(I)yrinic acid a,c-diamide adenosyltransferase [Anaerolineales bacterium]|nr:cob(I)yrinic acid a,c-diamide adenosyltransferase [Anaerolineales bacterium]
MPRITKVTTRRGDDGKTDLADGRRVWKDSKRIQAVGALDELNSAVGWARSECRNPDVAARLLEIQNDLLCAGAMLAGRLPKSKGPVLAPSRMEFLERETAALQEKLGPLENFLLPGGTPGAAALHLARAVCRRAERVVVALARVTAVAPAVRIYLNRLSDLLFQYARLDNQESGRTESVWKSR